MSPETHIALQVTGILAVLVAAVIWAERWRADVVLQADLATPGQPEEHRVLDFGPDVDVEQFVDLEGAVEDLEAADRLLDAGELAEAQRQVRKAIEVLQGRDEAALADQRWHALQGAAA